MVDDLIPSRELIPEELNSVTDYLNLNPELKVRFISGNGGLYARDGEAV
jgi:hypothetical protein